MATGCAPDLRHRYFVSRIQQPVSTFFHRRFGYSRCRNSRCSHCEQRHIRDPGDRLGIIKIYLIEVSHMK